METHLLSSPPTREEELREVARLLTLPEIARSRNLVRLLSFICEKYFSGKSVEIRESAIAVQALGRKKEGFDSQADPIVRVTARMLRKRLDEHYRNGGRSCAVQLLLPVGQYVPRFVRFNGEPYGDFPARDLAGTETLDAEMDSPHILFQTKDSFSRPDGRVAASEAVAEAYLRLSPYSSMTPSVQARKRAWRGLVAMILALLAAFGLGLWIGHRMSSRNESVTKPAKTSNDSARNRSAMPRGSLTVRTS